MNRDHSVIFEIATKYCISDYFVDYDGHSISSKGFLPTVVDLMVIWVKFSHCNPFWFTAHSCPLQFALIHGPNIPGSYVILFFTASDFTSITSHIPNWVLFLLWLCLFILSGVISPLIPSSMLDTYWPGEFIFQGPIFLPFHTVHGVLKARKLKWFALPFSSGPHFVRTLHLSIWPCTAWLIVSLSLMRLWSMWTDWLVFFSFFFFFFRNKIRFVYFIVLQVSPADRRKLEVEVLVVVVVNNLGVSVLAWFKLGFPMLIFKKNWRMTI